MIERRPSVWRKEKLGESGKPDLKMPLSTIAKFRGGIRLSSSPTTGKGNTGGGMSSRLSITATSIVLQMVSSPLAAEVWSIFMSEVFVFPENHKGSIFCRYCTVILPLPLLFFNFLLRSQKGERCEVTFDER